MLLGSSYPRCSIWWLYFNWQSNDLARNPLYLMHCGGPSRLSQLSQLSQLLFRVSHRLTLRQANLGTASLLRGNWVNWGGYYEEFSSNSAATAAIGLNWPELVWISFRASNDRLPFLHTYPALPGHTFVHPITGVPLALTPPRLEFLIASNSNFFLLLPSSYSLLPSPLTFTLQQSLNCIVTCCYLFLILL